MSAEVPLIGGVLTAGVVRVGQTDAYGLSPVQRAALPDALIDRLHRNVEFWLARLAGESAHPRAGEYIAWTHRELAHVEAHHAVFTAGMTQDLL